MTRRWLRPSVSAVRVAFVAVVTFGVLGTLGTLGTPEAKAQTFVDVWGSAGFETEESTQGVSLADFDGDGDIDIFITSLLVQIPNPFGDPFVLSGPDRLYRNDGGRFTDIAPALGLDDGGQGQGSAWADWNRDGELDLYVVRGLQAITAEEHLLYQQAPGGFDASPSRFVSAAGAGRGVCWADYDNDGDADAFVTNGLDSSDLLPDARVFLFDNDGAGGFSDVTIPRGLLDLRNGHACAWSDYDNDGDQDLYVANHGFEDPVLGFSDPQPNALYRNQLVETGTPSFVDVAAAAGVDAIGGLGPGLEGGSSSFGCAWADYDNDGFMDLFVASGFSGLIPFPTPNRLFRNEGDGSFSDRSLLVIDPDFEEASFGMTWGDYDNDGDLDLYVANASQPFATATNDFLRNSGPPFYLLSNVEVEAGVGVSAWATACASADLDGDGFLDIYSVKGTPGVEFLFPEADNLFMGQPNGNHWLHLDLVGTLSNPDGIGARVSLQAGGLPRMTRELSAGSGYQSMDDLRVEFGLGAELVAQRVEIRWPSGCVQVLADVAADQVLEVVEDCVATTFIRRQEEQAPRAATFPLLDHAAIGVADVSWVDPEPVLGDGRNLYYAHSSAVLLRLRRTASSVELRW